MEMTINDTIAERFRGPENREGKWVEVFRVEIGHAYPGFKATNSPFTRTSMLYTQVHIITLNNRHYIEFKSIHEIPHISSRDRNYPIGMNANHKNVFQICRHQ